MCYKLVFILAVVSRTVSMKEIRCPSDMYLSKIKDGSLDCLHCSDCLKGSGEIVPCQRDADRICVECPKGTFNDGTLNFCRPCAYCGHGQCFRRHCKKTHDVLCETDQRPTNKRKPSTCPKEMEKKTHKGILDKIFNGLKRFDEKIFSPNCPSGMYLGILEDESYDCLHCSDCQKGYGEVVPCQRDADRFCVKCPEGTFNDGTQNHCRLCTHCGPGQCFLRHCKRAHNAACVNDQRNPNITKARTCHGKNEAEKLNSTRDTPSDDTQQMVRSGTEDITIPAIVIQLGVVFLLK